MGCANWNFNYKNNRYRTLSALISIQILRVWLYDQNQPYISTNVLQFIEHFTDP
jgi:hypothetical protein